MAKKVRKNRKAAQRWTTTKVWIIDEGEFKLSFDTWRLERLKLTFGLMWWEMNQVSMLDGDLFDKLSKVGQIIRKRPEPFGGIQVSFCSPSSSSSYLN